MTVVNEIKRCRDENFSSLLCIKKKRIFAETIIYNSCARHKFRETTMKRILLYWTLITVTLVGSAQERTSNNTNTLSQRETHVTTTEALNVGYIFMRTGGGTRGSDVSKQNMQLIYTGQAIDSVTQSVTDCYYVFALQPKGFVIVSADERVEPILGYSYDNNFMVTNLPNHVRSWLGNYERQIEAVVKEEIAPETETTTKWSRLKSGQPMSTRSGGTVGPLLTTTWDQGQYYNSLCPVDANGPAGHVYTGCVATAMAQIINYHQYPQHGRGTHSYSSTYGTLSVNYGNANYNYALMPNALTATSTATELDAVATLIRDCGVAVNMSYSPTESSAFDQDARAALMNFFKYNPDMNYAEKYSFSNDEWETMLRNDLDAGNPVYYSGQGTGGHAFVCDGYNANGFFSFNFGWGGFCDGWYLTSNVNPGGHVFNNNQAAIFGIVPDSTGNVILGQMKGNSTFIVDEPLEFYHLMGHNANQGVNYSNSCNSQVTFVSANSENQLVADIIDFEDQRLTFYDGNGPWLRNLIGGSTNDLSPVVSTQNSLKITYSGNLFYAGFNLRISQDDGCRMVSLMTAVDTTSIHLAWTENGSATQWQIEYGTAGFTLGTGTQLTVSSNTYDITGLLKLTYYDVYIRSVCGNNQYGAWRKVTVMTEAPYWQDIVVSQPASYTIDGTTNSAIISCAEDFVWFTKTYNDNHNKAKFVSDIDLGGYKWKPVEYQLVTVDIDGDGHNINNLFIIEKGSLTALFSQLQGEIKNLGIENAYVRGGSEATAGFCGITNAASALVNCHIANSIIEGNDYVGGIVGIHHGSIKNCYANVELNASRWSGLMTGFSNGTITNCYTAGSIHLRSFCYYAGASGYSTEGNISYCYSVDMPMGVVGYKGMTEISDTSSFYYDGMQWILRNPINFEGNIETSLLNALNRGVVQMNDSTIKTWIADTSTINNGLPKFGNNFVVQCPNVANLTVKNIKNGGVSGVVLAWEDPDASAAWEIKYQPKGTSYDSAVMISASNNPDTIYGIPLGREYIFGVRRVCDGANRSGWVSSTEMVDLPYWTDIVTSQPEGYVVDAIGNVTISSAEGLAWLSVLVNGFHGYIPQTFSQKTITLTSDINLQGYRWYPIGRAWQSNPNYNTRFVGTFLGNGHAISEMYVNEKGGNLGLFGFAGFVYEGTCFRDIALTNGLVISYRKDSDEGSYGGLIGFGDNIKEIVGCRSDVTVIGVRSTGSLCGKLSSTQGEPTLVSNCCATGDVYGREATGGLIGEARGIIVQNSFARGNVYVLDGIWNLWYRGGLIGLFMSNAVVRNCYSTGTVGITDEASFYGKVIGCPDQNSFIQYVYGLSDGGMPVVGYPSSGYPIIDTSSFSNQNGYQALVTPVTIDGISYNNLLDALNVWVTSSNDSMLMTWVADSSNVNGGFPVLGDYFEPSCNNPSNVSATNITVVGDTLISTRIAWEQDGNPSGWEILYVGAQQSIDSGTIIPVNSNPCVLTNLPVGEVLDIYVRAVCDTNDRSGWSDFARYIPDKLRWTEVVTSQPEGYIHDDNGNVYISSAEGLAWLSSVANRLNGVSYYEVLNITNIYLMTDVDISAYRWTAMGSIDNFVFEGNGHTIYGLYCNEYENRQGLFSYINNCTIRNLNISGCRVYGLTTNGAIAGRTGGLIVNCLVNGEIYGVQYTGGLVGWSSGTILNSAFVGMADTRANIMLPNTYNGFIGGIIGTGSSYSPTVKNSYVAAEIPSSVWSGVVAGSGPGTFSEVYALNYPAALPLTCNNLESNSSFFSSSGTSWTLSTPPYVNGGFRTDLVDALNAWVDANNSAGIYRYWAADSTGANNGYPVLAYMTCGPATGSDTIQACDSYTWKGTVYTTSTELFDTLISSTGCDSIVTHHLIVNHPVHTAITEIVCDTYSWNGMVYTVSGNYTFSHEDANGCTQVDTLHLTVKHSTTGIDEHTACESFIWIDGVTYTESTNTPTFTLTNAAGCDSIVTLHLTVNNSTHNVETVFECDSFA